MFGWGTGHQPEVSSLGYNSSFSKLRTFLEASLHTRQAPVNDTMGCHCCRSTSACSQSPFSAGADRVEAPSWSDHAKSNEVKIRQPKPIPPMCVYISGKTPFKGKAHFTQGCSGLNFGYQGRAGLNFVQKTEELYFGWIWLWEWVAVRCQSYLSVCVTCRALSWGCLSVLYLCCLWYDLLRQCMHDSMAEWQWLARMPWHVRCAVHVFCSCLSWFMSHPGMACLLSYAGPAGQQSWSNQTIALRQLQDRWRGQRLWSFSSIDGQPLPN